MDNSGESHGRPEVNVGDTPCDEPPEVGAGPDDIPNPTTPLDIALDYITVRHWAPVPVPYRKKGPVLKAWEDLRIDQTSTPRYFNGQPQNIGVLMGPASGGLTDVDLDSTEAVRLAPLFLPPTEAVFGRASKRQSHWLYRTDLAETFSGAEIKLEDPIKKEGTKATILEIRIGGGGKGAQTVFPGSTHESGEPVEWDLDGDPAQVRGQDLCEAAYRLAAAALLARHWGNPGDRNDDRMALTGMLLRQGWSIEGTAEFVGAVTIGAGGENDPSQWLSLARCTKEKLDKGGQVYGFTKLTERVGEAVARRVAEWLGLDQRATTEKPTPLPAIFSMAALQGMEFPPIKYVVPDYIPEGLTIFAGRPKVGKSWFCLDIGIAVATGGPALGNIECEQGDVLYAALEDNPRRLQARGEQRLASETWPERFFMAVKWPRLDQGGLKQIEQWLNEHPEARLVIVDTLAKVRGTPKDTGRAYEADYKAVEGLHQLAIERGVAIVLIHHTRKMEADDQFDTVSGTLGLTGAADTILVIERGPQGVTLHGTGRDIENIESAIVFDRQLCRWKVLGAASDVRRSDARSKIINVLREAGEPLKPSDIAAATGMKPNNVKQLLHKMVTNGEIEKDGYGRYRYPGNSGHSGNSASEGP